MAPIFCQLCLDMPDMLCLVMLYVRSRIRNCMGKPPSCIQFGQNLNATEQRLTGQNGCWESEMSHSEYVLRSPWGDDMSVGSFIQHFSFSKRARSCAHIGTEQIAVQRTLSLNGTNYELLLLWFHKYLKFIMICRWPGRQISGYLIPQISLIILKSNVSRLQPSCYQMSLHN